MTKGLHAVAAMAVLASGYGGGFGTVVGEDCDLYLPPDDNYQTAPQRTVFRRPNLLPPAPPERLTKRQRRRLRGKGEGKALQRGRDSDAPNPRGSTQEREG